MKNEELVTMANYLLDYVINRGLTPSKVENWVCIIDLNNVGIT